MSQGVTSHSLPRRQQIQLQILHMLRNPRPKILYSTRPPAQQWLQGKNNHAPEDKARVPLRLKAFRGYERAGYVHNCHTPNVCGTKSDSRNEKDLDAQRVNISASGFEYSTTLSHTKNYGQMLGHDILQYFSEFTSN